ncbi:MAG: class II aldolase/adducin family protein [Thermoleophilaceae bacterium]
MKLPAEREAVAAACRRLAAEGLVIQTAGNISVRCGDEVVITPSGGVFEELEADQMTIVDMDGEVVDGRHGPSSEVALHLLAYARLDHVGAVVHTHAPMATALSCVVDEVPAVHYSMLSLGGAIKVAEYATFGTEVLARNVVAELERAPATLMRSHGAITYGGDLDQAVEQMRLLEWACTVYWRARMIGEPAVMTPEQAEDVVKVYTERNYGRLSEA